MNSRYQLIALTTSTLRINKLNLFLSSHNYPHQSYFMKLWSIDHGFERNCTVSSCRARVVESCTYHGVVCTSWNCTRKSYACRGDVRISWNRTRMSYACHGVVRISRNRTQKSYACRGVVRISWNRTRQKSNACHEVLRVNSRTKTRKMSLHNKTVSRDLG